MSNTYKHKNLAKYTKDLLEKIPQELQNYFDRSNNDLGELRKAKKELKDKIAKKEIIEEIRILETGEHLDFDIPEQEEILNRYNTQ